MERVGGQELGRETTSMGKVAFASFIGTAIEFYDFYIYGTAAALVFGGFSSLSSRRRRGLWPPSPRSTWRSSRGLWGR
jgi:hypothetical protein